MIHGKPFAEGQIDLHDLLRAQLRDGLLKMRFRYRDDGVEVDDARLGKTVLGSEIDLGRDAADSGRYGCHYHQRTNGLGFVARE